MKSGKVCSAGGEGREAVQKEGVWGAGGVIPLGFADLLPNEDFPLDCGSNQVPVMLVFYDDPQ